MNLLRPPSRSLISLHPLSVSQPNVIRRSFATVCPDKHDIYDIVIVGGGPAGLSLASALRSSYITGDLRVALLEGGTLDHTRYWKPETFLNRVSSLTPQSVRFLEGMGVWKYIARNRVQAYDGIQVWDGVSDSKISFESGLQENTSIVAYMIENANLVAALLSRLNEVGIGTVLDKTRVESISYGEDDGRTDFRSWPVVHTSSGKKLIARLLVGADGAESPVRKFADIESTGWDYGRHGVVATLKLQQGALKGPGRTAYQRFLPTGPVAMLPLPGEFASLVWSTTPTTAAKLKSLSREEFTCMVNAAFRLNHTDLKYIQEVTSNIKDEVAWRERSIVKSEVDPPKAVDVQENSVASFPLKMRHADSYISERIALVGDAAHTTHPLAGLGLNQGLGDVQSLMKSLEVSVRQGHDIGSILSLEPYFAEQYFKNNLQLGVVDKLHKLYGTTSKPVVALRSIGLNTVNAFDPLKKLIMDYTTGRRL